MSATQYIITVQAGQSLADIAVQEYGTVEGMVLILQANPGIGISDELTPGMELIIPGNTIVKTPGTTTEAAPEPVAAPIQQITITDSPVQSSGSYLAVKTITVQAGQSLADIALQEYGTFEGVILILQANPGLSITDQLSGGQELAIFTNYTVNLVKELVKVEPYASALQSLLAQWAALIKFPSGGITEESDPVFMEWLSTNPIPAQLVPQDGIMHWDGTKYTPFTTRQAGGKFEINTGIPTHYDPLTYDGQFAAKSFSTFGGSYGGGFQGNTSEGQFGSGGFAIASYYQATKVMFDVMLGSYARIFAYGQRTGVSPNDSTLPIFIGCKTNWTTGINKKDEWICIDDYAQLFEINMTNIKLTKGTPSKYYGTDANNNLVPMADPDTFWKRTGSLIESRNVNDRLKLSCTTATAIEGYSYNSGGSGVFGSGTSIGVNGVGNSIGVMAQSISLPFLGNNINPTLNSVETGLLLQRAPSTGTPINGIGIGLRFDILNNIRSPKIAAYQNVTMTDVTSGAETSSFEWFLSYAGVLAKKMELTGAGQLQLTKYGIGTFPGVGVKALQVDASGNVIEGEIGASAAIPEIPELQLSKRGTSLFILWKGNTDFLNYNPNIRLFRYTRSNRNIDYDVVAEEEVIWPKISRWRKMETVTRLANLGLNVSDYASWEMPSSQGEWIEIPINTSHWIESSTDNFQKIIYRKGKRKLILDINMPFGAGISLNYGLAIVINNPDSAAQPKLLYGPISKFRIGVSIVHSEPYSDLVHHFKEWIKLMKR